MWPNLYGGEFVRHKLIHSLKTQIMHFLPIFELTSDSLSTILSNPKEKWEIFPNFQAIPEL